MVAALLLLAAVVSPATHFGTPVDADRVVVDWSRVVSYFHSLEQSSDRIRVTEIGKSTEGRPMILATIAAPATLRRLDYYRDIQQRLADPRRTPPAEARKLIAEGKTVVLITCSIHSTEIASTHTAVQFAWQMATSDSPRTRAILENTIFLLIPSLNPDGVDLVTAWYRKTLGTPFEGTAPPELYQKYVGHDNNRDWYIFSQSETRNTVANVHNAWHPQIVYDVHQQGEYGSRMFLPPWLDPIDPNVDPIISQECNLVGLAIATDLTAAGKKGVVVNALYDFWTPARHYQAYHGGLRILSESASARIASPVTIRPGEISESGPGYNPRERSWNYLEPWLGGEWRLRDIIGYQLIAMESCLYQAALRRPELLANFYRIGQRAATRTTPYAFVFPGAQRDPSSARKLLETLRFGQVEVERMDQRFEAGGREYAAGSYVVRMQQPYSSFAKTLLERQHYPDLREYPGGPPRRPYDVTAQTLPLLMGVSMDTVAAPFSARGSISGKLPAAAPGLSAADASTWHRVNDLWNSGRTVYRDENTGDFRVEAVPGTRPVKRPRIALYKSYQPVADEGWTRWLLEQSGFVYTSLRNPDVRAGGLRARFDVIVFPSQPAASIANGYRTGAMPPEYCGGLGAAGARTLGEFVRAGGTLVFLNESARYAVSAFDLPLHDVTGGVSPSELYSPGSLLNVTIDRAGSLTYGLPHEFTIWSEHSPAWEAPSAESVVSYPKTGLLASGWLLGGARLAGRSALVDHRLGRGRVVLFGFRPQYRAQSYLTLKLFFNALLLQPVDR
ncbi:MAG: hypothetical protein IT160_18020 [Bryobacterales bacterium]|nr:hypothetical protein [Bryobacterales bacterium]